MDSNKLEERINEYNSNIEKLIDKNIRSLSSELNKHNEIINDISKLFNKYE